MSSTFTIIGTAAIAMVLAGYYAQKYGLPSPPPKIVAIDLGTTFSSIGIYEAVTGNIHIIPDIHSSKSVPSVVAFLSNGSILIGRSAVDQQQRNPLRTIYDAKRFIGKTFRENDPDFEADKKRYPFTIKLNENGEAFFEVPLDSGIKKIRPEEIGAIIIGYLRDQAERLYEISLQQAVISVPAEFDQTQRNATALAVQKAGMEVRRVISEPTAAALAYGLHKKQGVEYILVVDLGGGTLDVSLLWLQGGIFVTLAMAGNSRLGGQDFNDRVQLHLIKLISTNYGKQLENKEDLEQLRMAIEQAKLQLTIFPSANIDINLRTIGRFHYKLTRSEFESLNEDLLESVIDPIEAAIEDAGIDIAHIDEIVLVGGSTRIPRIRQIIGTYFGKAANHGIDPELAVVTGVAIQAGVIGGGWPLQVSAMELPTQRRKHHVYTRTTKRQSPLHISS